MRTITMTIKKKWFDMIKSGEKTVEYREVKPYWRCRLFKVTVTPSCIKTILWPESIIFRSGYRKDSPKIKVDISFISTIKEGQTTPLNTDKPVYAIHLKNVREI